MAKTINDWIKEDVTPLKRKGQRAISEVYFFRNPFRATHFDDAFMFAPSDGILCEQKVVKGCKEAIVNVKGKPYTLEEAMMDEYFDEDEEVIVINIFLTQYHRHRINLPYPGFIYTELLDSIQTYNRPMLNFEKDLTKGVINWNEADYLFKNERRLDRVYSPKLGGNYYMLWVADYDVTNLNSYYSELEGAHVKPIVTGKQLHSN